MRMLSHLIANALTHGRLDVNNRREQTVGEVGVHCVYKNADRFQGRDIGRQCGEVALKIASDGDQKRSDFAQVFFNGLNITIEFCVGAIKHGVNGIIVRNLFAVK